MLTQAERSEATDKHVVESGTLHAAADTSGSVRPSAKNEAWFRRARLWLAVVTCDRAAAWVDTRTRTHARGHGGVTGLKYAWEAIHARRSGRGRALGFDRGTFRIASLCTASHSHVHHAAACDRSSTRMQSSEFWSKLRCCDPALPVCVDEPAAPTRVCLALWKHTRLTAYNPEVECKSSRGVDRRMKAMSLFSFGCRSCTRTWSRKTSLMTRQIRQLIAWR